MDSDFFSFAYWHRLQSIFLKGSHLAPGWQGIWSEVFRVQLDYSLIDAYWLPWNYNSCWLFLFTRFDLPVLLPPLLQSHMMYPAHWIGRPLERATGQALWGCLDLSLPWLGPHSPGKGVRIWYNCQIQIQTSPHSPGHSACGATFAASASLVWRCWQHWSNVSLVGVNVPYGTFAVLFGQCKQVALAQRHIRMVL